MSKVKAWVESEIVRTRQIKCLPRIHEIQNFYTIRNVWNYFWIRVSQMASSVYQCIFDSIFFRARGTAYFFSCVRHFITIFVIRHMWYVGFSLICFVLQILNLWNHIPNNWFQNMRLNKIIFVRKDKLWLVMTPRHLRFCIFLGFAIFTHNISLSVYYLHSLKSFVTPWISLKKSQNLA